VLNRRFPGVVAALASLEGEFVLDGELVALDPQGRPSFQLLQANISQSLPIHFYAFDLLNRNGELVVNLPFPRRRDWRVCLSPPKIRFGCLRSYRRQLSRSLERYASSAWRAS
jgi:ATP dependent DNA ligase domain